MRLARDHKYALLLKMVQRLYIAGQHPDWAGITPVPAKLVFGTYKPTDKQGIVELVATGVEKGVLSLETGIRMLTEAGLPIDDATEEIERIQARQFDKARLLADATGDARLVADFLGVTVTEPDTPPAPDLPPAGNIPAPSSDPDDDPEGRGGGNTP
jgi:hypothetical protein